QPRLGSGNTYPQACDVIFTIERGTQRVFDLTTAQNACRDLWANSNLNERKDQLCCETGQIRAGSAQRSECRSWFSAGDYSEKLHGEFCASYQREFEQAGEPGYGCTTCKFLRIDRSTGLPPINCPQPPSNK